MTTSINSGARLLLWASASFLLVIGSLLTTALVYQARTGSSAEPTTQAEVDLAQPWWTITGHVLLVPIALAAVGSIKLAIASPRPRIGVAVTALWVITVIVGVAYAITWHASMTFTEPVYSESSAAVAAQWLVRGGVIPLALLATGLLAHQYGARVVVVISVVLLGTWLAAVVFGIHLPPALTVVAWIPLGVRILRAARRKPAGSVPAAA